MRACIVVADPNLVVIQARAEGPGGMVGDATWEIRPGESLCDGFSFEELLGMGLGEFEVPDDDEAE